MLICGINFSNRFLFICLVHFALHKFNWSGVALVHQPIHILLFIVYLIEIVCEIVYYMRIIMQFGIQLQMTWTQIWHIQFVRQLIGEQF